MRQIVIYFWQMCLLKTGPQRLPDTVPILVFMCAVYLIIAAATLGITRTEQDVTGILGTSVFGLLMEGAIVWTLLAFKRVTPRFIPTMIALLGTNAIILVILLPMNAIIFETDPDSMLGILAEVVALLCLGWWLAIAGSILHHAINISIIQGAAVIFVMELVTVMATRSIFPAT